MHPIVVAWIGVFARVAVPLLMLSVGSSTAELSLSYLRRRRRLLLRALLIVQLLVPAVVIGFALVLPVPRIVKILCLSLSEPASAIGRLAPVESTG